MFFIALLRSKKLIQYQAVHYITIPSLLTFNYCLLFRLYYCLLFVALFGGLLE
jgi:hypothetical protein